MQWFSMKTVVMGGAVGAMTALASSVEADTMAYWRFEAGPAGTDVVHTGGATGIWSSDIQDVSGNNNDLSTWETGGGAGYQYRADVAESVTGTGQTNNLSVKNTGTGPAMWNNTLWAWSPTAWTIEVSFKIEAGGYRTIIGRDSQGGFVDGSDDALAALYLQKQDDESLAIKFQDSAGYFHTAETDADFIDGFDFNVDPDGDLAPWYSAAAVSDGSLLSLYVLNHDNPGAGYALVAQTDLTLSASTDTSLSTGHGDGGDWDAGNFSIGRGLFGGGHGDRAYGFLDEIRFTDGALAPDQFIFANVPEPASLAVLGLGGLTALGRRRRSS